MAAKMSYGTETERRQHASAIHMLSLNTGLPEDSVQQLYENELKTLAEHARIRDFLPVLVARKIKGKLYNIKH